MTRWLFSVTLLINQSPSYEVFYYPDEVKSSTIHSSFFPATSLPTLVGACWSVWKKVKVIGIRDKVAGRIWTLDEKSLIG